LKVFFKNIQFLLIVVLVVLLLLQRSCSSNQDIIEPTIITKVETKWDTITINKVEYVPKWIEKVVTVYENDTIIINTPIDTLEVLKEYYAKNVYVDKIVLDSLGTVTITDTITQNKIFSRKIQSDILIPTTTLTQEIYLNNREFYWGLNAAGRSSQINYLGGGILYKSKRKNIYGLGIGVNENFEPIISGSYYMKIGKK
tara:strand:+ start:415 stop:1011 length:597 start_codon:yes stop_codon:yes gene_type:complete